jgi:flagellar motor switch protein FliN
MMDVAPTYLEHPSAGQAFLTLRRAAQDVLGGIIGRTPTLTYLGRRPVTAANLTNSEKNVLVEFQFEQPKDRQYSVLILAHDADLARLFALAEPASGEEVLTAEALLSLGDMFSSFLDAIGGELTWLSPQPRAWLSNLEPIGPDAGSGRKFDLPPLLAQEQALHEIVISAAFEAEAACSLIIIIGEKGEQALLGLDHAPPRSQPSSLPTGQGMTAAPSGPPSSHIRAVGNIQAAAFRPLTSEQPSAHNSSIDLIRDVPLKVTVELGRASLTVREILALGAGSVVELDRLAGESVDVLVNDRLIARGEVVIVDESFGVRVTELLK